MDSNGSAYKTVVVFNDAKVVAGVCEKLLAEARANDFSEDDVFGIHLALEEAFVNAVKHGNKQDPEKKVTIEYLITPEKFDVSITDQGNGFDPEAVPDCRSEENIFKSEGRGVLLMRSYMDVVEYNQAGNRVHMTKYKSKIESKD